MLVLVMSTKFTTISLLNDFASKLRQRFGKNFVEHFCLAPYTSAKIGGVADYLVVAHTVADLIDAVKIASRSGVIYKIIGGGSGILVSDIGVPGLVIINRSSTIRLIGESQVMADSGVANLSLVNWAAARNLGGLEFISTIPGSIGGALATLATYDNQKVISHIKSVSLLTTKRGEFEVKTYAVSELEPSFFQSVKYVNHPVILAMTLQLARLSQDDLFKRLKSYRQVSRWWSGSDRYLGGLFLELPNDNLGSQQSTTGVINEIQRKFLDYGPLELIDCKRHIIKIKRDIFASQIRTRLVAYRREVASLGVRLEDRLNYLGYWPEHEENQQDSENFY